MAADIEVSFPAVCAGGALGAGVGRRAGGQVIVDLDSTVVTAHSDKERGDPMFKKTFGFAPMCVFVDHGEQGTGEPRWICGRGTASPRDSADRIAAADAAVVQLAEAERGPLRAGSRHRSAD